MSTNLSAVDLRTGAATDVPTVERLMADAFDPRFGEAWTRGQCVGVLGMPGVWLTMAEVDRVPAGFALARAVADEAELLLLATARPFWGLGVGGALLHAVIDAARARDLASLHLEVRAGNEASRLYTRAGFAKVGERRGYYRGRDGSAYNALTYRLSLR